ncbi:unnamed protein product [Vitrella brassicaformis CCMP3155]|uniref:Uncharacterized protein n=1 Tax=Vitrella brassicaformis (strain CCMP3155) TaxID=1169540 RepID=A0A0G4G0A2_VITBC|nr:unnamed protein product [Vitrella brassicaformis CCMP3155]|eukprot:CEM21118.1 unnamed protein product [Vitrella brassicaformis CCMP3155]
MNSVAVSAAGPAPRDKRRRRPPPPPAPYLSVLDWWPLCLIWLKTHRASLRRPPLLPPPPNSPFPQAVSRSISRSDSSGSHDNHTAAAAEEPPNFTGASLLRPSDVPAAGSRHCKGEFGVTERAEGLSQEADEGGWGRFFATVLTDNPFRLQRLDDVKQQLREIGDCTSWMVLAALPEWRQQTVNDPGLFLLHHAGGEDEEEGMIPEGCLMELILAYHGRAGRGDEDGSTASFAVPIPLCCSLPADTVGDRAAVDEAIREIESKKMSLEDIDVLLQKLRHASCVSSLAPPK